MDFSRDYFIHYYEVGPSGRLTIQALLGYLEDIAILHSEARNLGLAYYEENHCGWMLVKWDISIAGLPRFAETIRVETRINGMKSFFADREFTLRAQDGTVLAQARANWILVDTDLRRPKRIPQEQWDRFGVSPESASRCVTIPDVPAIGEEGGEAGAEGAARGEGGDARPSVRVFTASNGDIDTNRHVNNLCFVRWALDSLSEDYLFAHEVITLRAHYRKELAHGAEASVMTVAEGTVTRHTVRSIATECCSLEIGWREL